MSIVVDKSVNKIPYAQLIFRDGDPASENFSLSNQDFFIPGKNIEIKVGYHGDELTVFKGIVVKHGLKVKQNGSSFLKVECKDKSVKLSIGRKNKYFAEQKDSEIFEEIINNYNLEKEVETTTVQHKEMVQYYSTDWDFIVSRAEVNGMLVIASDNKITIKKPTISSITLSLVYGATVLSFEAEMDARNQFSSIKSNSWDYSNQEMVDTDAEDPSFQQGGNLTVQELSQTIGLENLDLKHSGKVEESELQIWANAAAIKSELSKIRGSIKCKGYNNIKPGDTLELSGFGGRFNGEAFVSGVTQQIVDNVWTTDIVFGLSPAWFIQEEKIMEVEAAGLLPGIKGVQIGIVSALEGDPDGEDRIQVKLPVIDPADEGIWSRISTLDAGENRGSFFRPEIGDEVLVAFINGDPRDAVVIGMLNSSAKPAPLATSDDNHEKGFVSRSEMKFIFNDNKNSITAETPSGNKLIISEEEKGITLIDENRNKIVMNQDGITIESAKDLILKSAMKLVMESGTNLELSGGTELKIEGTAGTKVSSSAIVEVQGSLVKIN
jgi:Rhs element Vgr protein